MEISDIKPGDYVSAGGIVGVVGAIAESIDGNTYLQIISPKAAALGHANNCDWVVFYDGMIEPITPAQYAADVHSYMGLPHYRAQQAIDNLKSVAAL